MWLLVFYCFDRYQLLFIPLFVVPWYELRRKEVTKKVHFIHWHEILQIQNLYMYTNIVQWSYLPMKVFTFLKSIIQGYFLNQEVLFCIPLHLLQMMMTVKGNQKEVIHTIHNNPWLYQWTVPQKVVSLETCRILSTSVFNNSTYVMTLLIFLHKHWWSVIKSRKKMITYHEVRRKLTTSPPSLEGESLLKK